MPNKLQRLVRWVTGGKWELWPSGTVRIIDGCDLTIKAGARIANFVHAGGRVTFENDESPAPPDVLAWARSRGLKVDKKGRIEYSINCTTITPSSPPIPETDTGTGRSRTAHK